MKTLDAVLSRIDQDIDQSVERLFALLRIASVSTDPAFKEQCQAAAEHVATDLKSIGFDAAVRPTAGHPVVVGKSNGVAGPRVSCFTAIMMCSRSIPSIYGRHRRSSRASKRCPTAAKSLLRAAPATTRAKR